MTKLSWNEIRQRAVQFARAWEGVTRERAEAQTFWNAFFGVFGIERRHVASFEEPVRSIKGTYGSIDLLYRGRMLAEHKSASEKLDKAESQAFQYIQDLFADGRADEVPRYVVLSNFHHVVLYDLEPEDQHALPIWEGRAIERLEFSLEDLHKNVRHFAFLIGQKTHRFGEEDPANLDAAQLMAELHDAVKEGGYSGKELERLLVRLLFCIFADDTGIFSPGQFQLYIENRTRPDGSDLGIHLHALFEMLNTPEGRRQSALEEDLNAFPYINGELFAEHLRLAAFNRGMRDRLLAAARFDWSRISPAVFGSLFQGILDDKERRQIGAHYTAERDILKLIRPLFLDTLREEFEQIKRLRRGRAQRLQAFQDKLAGLKLLDPACGCGNFLVIAYRELRRLELEAIKLLHQFSEKGHELPLGELAKLSKVDVHQFYGIEIGEWAARIAETALWLTDHQMNTELSLAAGNQFMRIPLRSSPHIRCANALRMDWNELLPAGECSHVLGNPPFVGKKEQNREQKEDHARIWGNNNGSGILDYVTCWYVKAGEYTRRHRIPCAFVSTNSISQGEQVGVLWARLFEDFQIKIHFAHTTFAWQSEARGAAHVHVVIIGFGAFDAEKKTLFVYEHPKAEPTALEAGNINPYLADAPDVVIRKRMTPLCDVPAINYGSMMIDKPRTAGDDEGLIITPEERDALLRECPEFAPYIRELYGGDEFISGKPRWCLWLVDVPATLLRECDRLRQRLQKVKRFRQNSPREATRKLAARPYLFGEIRQPDTEYLLIPKVSSEARDYLPVGFLPPEAIASGSALVLPSATPYHFGIMQSAMHTAWLAHVGGRLESRFQYSSQIVYNNFPWPDPNAKKREAVESAARKILEVREKHFAEGSSIADIYDPLFHPIDLAKAHRQLDRAVDRCYRSQRFENARNRVAFLFALYKDLTEPLTNGH